jgi:hypothetical protein
MGPLGPPAERLPSLLQTQGMRMADYAPVADIGAAEYCSEMQPTLNALLLTISCLAGACDASDKPVQPSHSTYWRTTPRLPKRPAEFCQKAVAVFKEQFHTIRCQDSLAGAYGIRGQSRDTELVILQGASEEWFAFGYQNANRHSSSGLVPAKELLAIVNSLEDGFKN